MKTRLIPLGVAVMMSASSTWLQAAEMVSPASMAKTENGVFMSNGRYFVAGASGIQEVKTSPDYSSHCKMDTVNQLTVCTLVAPTLNGNQCFYSGLVADDDYLYATCTVWLDGSFGPFLPPKYASLVRVQPGASRADQVLERPFAKPVWYNGMTRLDADSLLMTQSISSQGTGTAAVVKLDITNASNLSFTMSDWLPKSADYLNPNGIMYDKGYVYFVGGQNLYRIAVNTNQTSAAPVLLYQTPNYHMIDDLTMFGSWVAVAEVALINGLGVNTITGIHKTGWFTPVKIATGAVQLSSLDVDPGTFHEGDFIGTSYYQGGLHRIVNPY